MRVRAVTAPAPVRAGIGYLPGLDGLRAVSVLAVIAYHLELGWATGGYLGVEVFFVVSGYLITSLLLDEQRRTGAVRLGAFWARRARRLLPAVVALLLGVLTWTALVLGGAEVERFRGEALASLLYVQNWHLVLTDEPYFASFGRPSPLRHLWSLAIEEQFYLLWPVVLPALLRGPARRHAAGVLLLGAAGSVALMAATADIAAPERAYYATDTRAFGILLGAALAFGWRPERFRPPISTVARRTLEWGGTAALTALVWQLARRSEYDPWTFPWGFLVVDVTTIAVIVAATHPASGLRRWLGAAPAAALGRRSYSLYLWHWPVIVFTRPGRDWPLDGAAGLLGRLVLTAVLAEASYRLVEQPFRDGRAQAWLWSVADRASARRLLAPAVAAATLPVLLLVATVVTATTPEAKVVGASTPVTIALDMPPATATSTTTTTTTTTPPPAMVAATVAPTTAPPPPSTVPRPVPDVTVVGESVTLGADPTLRAVLGQRVQVDAVEGRSFEQGIELIELLALAGRLTPTVVVHLGTNGVVPSGGLERIAQAVGPDRRLVLTTVRVARPWEGQVNDTIRGFVPTCPNCAIADWHGITGNQPGLTTDDGVHLTDIGKQWYTRMVQDQVGP